MSGRTWETPNSSHSPEAADQTARARLRSAAGRQRWERHRLPALDPVAFQMGEDDGGIEWAPAPCAGGRADRGDRPDLGYDPPCGDLRDGCGGAGAMDGQDACGAGEQLRGASPWAFRDRHLRG